MTSKEIHKALHDSISSLKFTSAPDHPLAPPLWEIALQLAEANDRQREAEKRLAALQEQVKQAFPAMTEYVQSVTRANDAIERLTKELGRRGATRFPQG